MRRERIDVREARKWFEREIIEEAEIEEKTQGFEYGNMWMIGKLPCSVRLVRVPRQRIILNP